MTILKVIGCEDCEQDNNFPLWGPGGKEPSCRAILAIFQKKSSHFNDVLHVYRAIEKTKLLRWGLGGEAPSR